MCPKYLFTNTLLRVSLHRMKGKEVRKRLGLAVLFFRKEAKLSQEKLAELVGISTQALGFIERGLFCPRFKTLARIAWVLKVQVWVVVKKPETANWNPY